MSYICSTFDDRGVIDIEIINDDPQYVSRNRQGQRTVRRLKQTQEYSTIDRLSLQNLLFAIIFPGFPRRMGPPCQYLKTINITSKP